MRIKSEWTEAKDALTELYEVDYPFKRWETLEGFVSDMLELMEAAYSGGYEDALDDLRESADRLSGKLDESMAELELDR